MYNNDARKREHIRNMEERRIGAINIPSPSTQRVYQPIQPYTPQNTVYGSVRERIPPRTVNIPKANDSFDKSHSVGYTDYGKQMPSLKTYTPAEKKKSEDAWYNKINHGSFKEDDWFTSMVRNQEKAENWYTGTYGEKEGKKEYLKLHNRLLAVPYKQHQKEAERFKDYTAEDFKVPVLQKSNYSFIKNTQEETQKKESENIGNREQATNVIKKNASIIRDAAYRYGVEPVIVAACIYGEQALNYDWKDTVTDMPLYFLDTSIGVGQVKVSTAKELEDMGYVEPITYIGSVNEWNGNNYVKKHKWNIPGYGTYVANSREQAIAKRLSIDSECINYVAAYVASLQKSWEWAYPDIHIDTRVAATLYNQGVGTPKSNPKPNPFGEFIGENYEYIKSVYEENLKQGG